jgi:tetratricopeptide (TPR) repeat protein
LKNQRVHAAKPFGVRAALVPWVIFAIGVPLFATVYTALRAAGVSPVGSSLLALPVSAALALWGIVLLRPAAKEGESDSLQASSTKALPGDPAHPARGDAGPTLREYEHRLALVQQSGDRRGQENALGYLGNVCFTLGRVHQALGYYAHALAIAQESGDRQSTVEYAAHLGNLGNVYAQLGELPQALEYYEQALTRAREMGDRRGEGHTLNHLGNVQLAHGELQRAVAYYEQALHLARASGDREGEGVALHNWGVAAYQMGDRDNAIHSWERAVALLQEIENRYGEGIGLQNLGSVYRDGGESGEAANYFTAALKRFDEIGSPQAEEVRRLLEKERRLDGSNGN